MRISKVFRVYQAKFKMAAFRRSMRFLCLLSKNNLSATKVVSNNIVQKAFMQTLCARSQYFKQTQMIKCYCYSTTSYNAVVNKILERSISSTINKAVVSGRFHHVDVTSTGNLNRSYSSGPSEEKDQNEPEKEGKKKDSFSKQKIAAGIVLTVLFAGSSLYALNKMGTPELDDEGSVIEDEFGGDSLMSNVQRFSRSIQNPSRKKLLPDPVQYPYIQPPYTLVLEMKGVLVWPEHDINKGWRFKKRPGVKYLLQKTCDMFEIVIYTSESGMTMDPIINQIDPHGFVKYRLYRDATKYLFWSYHHVKDLDCLNRDLKKVIIVDFDEKSYQLQDRNGFKIMKYEGDDDEALVDLTHFLLALAATGVDDVRPVLDYYKQFDDPIMAFKENQRKLLEEQRAMEQQKPKTGLGGFFKR